MFQTIHAHLLPRVSTYAAANSVYDKAVPLKVGDYRGLKDKRDAAKTVGRFGEAVCFKYHSTVLVRWLRHKIELRTWDSMSSAAFANRFLPEGIHAVSLGGKMYYAQDGKYYEPSHAPLVFNEVGGKWVVDESTVMRYRTHTLNRKRAAHVRKVMKPFMDWLATTRRLGVEYLALDADDYQPMHAAKTLIAQGHIPEEHYQKLASYSFFHADKVFNELYILGGAVEEGQQPIGEAKKISKYSYSPAWSYV